MADLASLESILSYSFQRKELLSLALTHRSFHFRAGEEQNEKLEFLGDSVLGLAISDLLMRRFPEASEGDLSKMRAALVNAQVLAIKAAAISLGEWLRLGGGEERGVGGGTPAIRPWPYEAVLGGGCRRG